MTERRALALFDLDGTLTRRDTLSDLLYRSFGVAACLRAGLVLAPDLLGAAIGAVERDVAKVRLLRHFFGGMACATFRRLAGHYARAHLPLLLRPAAEARLLWHLQRGDRVVVVSASAEDWIRPWAEPLGLEVLGTRLERRDGRLTGYLDGENCRGGEKVKRVQALLDPAAYHPIHAYGDTSGDHAMLALAHHPVYRGLRGRLPAPAAATD
ncbi:HAD-IB family hydrolase [Sediminicurvatus halobius]|uniref:HAD-IB family hydrolase n=1 Tax=Sediminicurvatus halobius TaxID=2182432 RepID=A0A2U2N4Z2_9GAMM|nr:HAD-IB family hydrolase [Spiribacter halobius]PWG64118.1 HAD-IB family hydrolase [Spiribacter halobius]UEX78764.1 HAD-IB family hydrolase [Spiribacter halobius]